MVKHFEARLDPYTAKVTQWTESGNDDIHELNIYEGDEHIYKYPNILYSLRDAATLARAHLNMRGKRIKWEETKE